MLLFISWNAYGITILISLSAFYGYILRKNRLLLRQLFSRVAAAFFRGLRATVAHGQGRGASAAQSLTVDPTPATSPADSNGEPNTPAS